MPMCIYSHAGRSADAVLVLTPKYVLKRDSREMYDFFPQSELVAISTRSLGHLHLEDDCS
jgi:hypothetical protein